jgi:hypothetical protein
MDPPPVIRGSTRIEKMVRSLEALDDNITFDDSDSTDSCPRRCTPAAKIQQSLEKQPTTINYVDSTFTLLFFLVALHYARIHI